MPSDYESTAQRASREAGEQAERNWRGARAFIRRNQPAPGPGRSPTEKERLEEQRQAREAAAAQKAAEARELAAQALADALAEKQRIAGFGTQVANQLGAARHQLSLAVGGGNLEAAIEAARDVAELELVDAEVRRRGASFAKEHRGPGWYSLSAGRV